MGDGFEVDLSVMGQFVLSLRTSTSTMEQALNALRDTGRNTVGSMVLDEAANDFQNSWRYGLDQLKGKTKDCGDRMDATFQNYDDVERALTDQFTKFVGMLNVSHS